MLHPTESFSESSLRSSNDLSLVILIRYGETAFLLMADIEKKAEESLLRFSEFLVADVLKVPHHGSVTSSSLDFLKAVAPEAAVISVGERNPYGHPSEEVLRRFEFSRIEVFRTDRDQAQVFRTDGAKVEKERWR